MARVVAGQLFVDLDSTPRVQLKAHRKVRLDVGEGVIRPRTTDWSLFETMISDLLQEAMKRLPRSLVRGNLDYY